MTRVTAKLLRQARSISPLLPPLLRATRDARLAQLELKWIKEELLSSEWVRAVALRSRLVPLQYILKSQPFGELSIVCRKGVLIPRWETEEWSTRLSEILARDTQHDELNVVDACSGSGCVPLLLHHLLSSKFKLNVVGFDIADRAVELARENLQVYKSKHPKCSSLNVAFVKRSVFDPDLVHQLPGPKEIDLVTSNPPYIPAADYKKSMQRNGVERSVKLHEPSLALVGDNEFYIHLVRNLVEPSQAKSFVFELGYDHQAECVRSLLDPSVWDVGVMYDSCSKIRCVVGWKKSSRFTDLRELCNLVY
ncbi:uncharacterized protein LODBEIA_P15670 [Lodderomyces beijingensis]|uniref:Methyltransferase small domain-containing protein n=1 Tax=Lodderomyces beijingensis TaxID=1775926 RepID=A0ABP0ZGP4_9ASCO